MMIPAALKNPDEALDPPHCDGGESRTQKMFREASIGLINPSLPIPRPELNRNNCSSHFSFHSFNSFEIPPPPTQEHLSNNIEDRSVMEDENDSYQHGNESDDLRSYNHNNNHKPQHHCHQSQSSVPPSQYNKHHQNHCSNGSCSCGKDYEHSFGNSDLQSTTYNSSFSSNAHHNHHHLRVPSIRRIGSVSEFTRKSVSRISKRFIRKNSLKDDGEQTNTGSQRNKSVRGIQGIRGKTGRAISNTSKRRARSKSSDDDDDDDDNFLAENHCSNNNDNNNYLNQTGKSDQPRKTSSRTPVSSKESFASSDTAAKEGSRPAVSGDIRGPGAFSEGGRAFGERPAWAQPPRNSASLSIERLQSVVSHESNASGDMEQSIDTLDPLDDEIRTEYSNDGCEAARDSRFHQSGGTYESSSTDVVDREQQSNNVMNAEVSTEFLPLRSQSSSMSMQKAVWCLQSRRNFATSVVLFLVLLMAAFIVVVTTVRGREPASLNGSIDESTCNIDTLSSFPNNQVIDRESQCLCQQLVSTMNESTTLAYSTLWETVLHKLYTNHSGDVLSTQSYLGFELDMFNCSQAHNIALLDAVSGGGMDVQNYALSVLYFSLNGPAWKFKLGWRNYGSACSWRGITCDENGNVIRLSLPSNQVEGSLPAEIGLLSSLKILDFSGNTKLKGLLPHQLGLLTNLEVLRMSFCAFSGTIPTVIGAMISLETVEFNTHALTGSIPTEVGNLERLDRLVLANGQLNGTLPSELLSLSFLEILDINRNHVGGNFSASIRQLTSLRSLDVAFNAFNPTEIPPDFWGLTNLVTLTLSEIDLHGTIPADGLHTLTNLVKLELVNNNLEGELPSEIGLLTMLSRLMVPGNTLEGSIPSEIGMLTRLEVFDISENLFLGRLPDEILQLTNIYEMHLERNYGLFGDLEQLCDYLRQFGVAGFVISVTKSEDQLQTSAGHIQCSCCEGI